MARLAGAGAVTLGKLNMTELAMGALGDNPHHGHARNPWNLERCTGGSSSGSGVAVAAGLALGAIGTDTGGSIRLPAAACGITGLKPTYGRVSRAGGMALSWSNDHLGPMARTARDCALMLQAMAGADPLDATASARPVPDYLAELDAPVAGLRVGVPENFFFQGIDAEMEAGVRAAIATLVVARGAGHRGAPARSAGDERRDGHHLAQRVLRAARGPAAGEAGRRWAPSRGPASSWGCACPPTTTCRRCACARAWPARSRARSGPRWTCWPRR